MQVSSAGMPAIYSRDRRKTPREAGGEGRSRDEPPQGSPRTGRSLAERSSRVAARMWSSAAPLGMWSRLSPVNRKEKLPGIIHMTKNDLGLFPSLGCHTRVWFWLLGGLEEMQTPSTEPEPTGLWLHFPFGALQTALDMKSFAFEASFGLDSL